MLVILKINKRFKIKEKIYCQYNIKITRSSTKIKKLI